MQELRFMTAMMKDKLNLRLGSEVVREIVLKAGRVDVPPAEVPDAECPPRSLTAQEWRMIDEQSAVIVDPETRQTFIDLMRASLEQQR
jgi:hypothetical protein